MRTRRLAAIFILLTVTATGTIAVAAPAQAGKRTDITVRTSDQTPASGQTFRIHGKFIDSGTLAANHVVKVQTRRDDRWVRIRGAQVRTDETGRYRMRLILSQRGRRLMRVVGVDRGPGPNAYQRFRVRVHR